MIFFHDVGGETHTKHEIASSDLVLAEISFPSTGSGIEIGWASASKMPIASIFIKGPSPSSSLRFVTYAMREYDSESLTKVIQQIINKSIEGEP